VEDFLKVGNVGGGTETAADAVVDEVVTADKNVTGLVRSSELTLIARARQELSDWSSVEVPALLGGDFTSFALGLLGVVPRFAAGHIGYNYRTVETQTVEAVLNGDLVAEPLDDIVKEDGETVPVVQAAGIVSVSVKRTPKHKGHVARIPVLAGDIASELKLRHGLLIDDGDNQELIRADTVRKVEAARKDGNKLWRALRSRDALLVVMHAEKMFWLMSADEADVADLYSRDSLTVLRGARAKLARAPTRC
jgi:hypothetical protein